MENNWIRSKISAYKQNRLSEAKVEELESHNAKSESRKDFLSPDKSTEDRLEEPEIYIEVPYIHPVTQERLYRRVLSTSREAVLFFEEQERGRPLDKDKSSDKPDKRFTLPFATINPSLEEAPGDSIFNVQRKIIGNLVKQELKEDKSNIDITIDKQLPFKDNPWKQAAFYRFTSILVSVLLLITLFIHFFSN